MTMSYNPNQAFETVVETNNLDSQSEGGEPLPPFTPHTKSTVSTSTLSDDPMQVLPISTEQQRHDNSLPPPSSTLKKKRATVRKTNDERRLVEYFIIVSSIPREVSPRRGSMFFTEDGLGSSVNPVPEEGGDEREEEHVAEEEEYFKEKIFDPVISARYPKEDIDSNPLHESVTSFCFPTGEIRLLSKANMPKVHYFVTTGRRGKQLYGTCLTLFEPYNDTKEENEEETPSQTNNNKNTTTTIKFLPKCLCILSVHPYLTAFREYLTQLHRLVNMGNMPLPIERYIINFCTEIPAPPPGSFEVQTTILDSVIKFWSPPHNQPIAWVSLPFSHLFECMDVHQVIMVWNALVLERQVLITSTQLSLLTECCEIFLSFLFPMKWSHAYIPLVPQFLLPILSAPMPYLCGIDKKCLGKALKDLSNECIVVDLDTNQVTLGPNTPPLPRIPKAMEKNLGTKLETFADLFFREARSLHKDADHSNRGHNLPLHLKTMADNMWESKLCLYDEAFHLTFTPEQSRKNILNGNDYAGLETLECDTSELSKQSTGNGSFRSFKSNGSLDSKQSRWDSVQEAFVNIFVSLFCTYRKFLVFPSKETGTFGGAGFDSKAFLSSQKYEAKAFLSELMNTQLFDDFVTKRLYGSGAADVLFFDQAIDKYIKNGYRSYDPTKIASSIESVASEGSVFRPSSASSVMRMINKRRRNRQVKEPLLQSAAVHRKLKTIVPPEPSGADLPEGTFIPTLEDDARSTTSSLTHDTASLTPSNSKESDLPQEGEDNAEKQSEKVTVEVDLKDKHDGYFYVTFPSTFDNEMFGSPRPLPAAILAEFDRQRDNAGKFRRRTNKLGIPIIGPMNTAEASTCPEVTTFTVFFMSFTAAIGTDLADFILDDLSNHPESSPKSTLEEAKATAIAQIEIAFEMLEMMRKRELKPDPVSYQCLIEACGRVGDIGSATKLLARMHDDGIVADGVVYSSLVSAFSAESPSSKNQSAEKGLDLPEWANSTSVEVDWGRIQKRSWRRPASAAASDYSTLVGKSPTNESMLETSLSFESNETIGQVDKYLTNTIFRHIVFGENLLEIVYPDISIDTDDEYCPNCNNLLSDDDVVNGWVPDPQDYTTKCSVCSHKFVPRFTIQSTSKSFIGSQGPGTALLCERLSPWVLQKELKTKMNDHEGGIEDLLDPEWRAEENKNAVLWWNLILSFMRYRFPFTFLLQGNFEQSLISPMPEDEHN